MLNAIRFRVTGKPQTQGSKRAFALKRRDGSLVTRPNGSPVINTVDDNPNGKAWKALVALAAQQAHRGPLLLGPLRVEFTFYAVRPANHFGTGRNKQALKSHAPAFPITRPDALKLARAVEDAMTGVVWKDDAQIVEEALAKRYGDWSGVEIAIMEMECEDGLRA